MTDLLAVFIAGLGMGIALVLAVLGVVQLAHNDRLLKKYKEEWEKSRPRS